MAHDVFISTSSKDKAIADAVCAHLEAGGVRCWIAPRDIRPGSNWGESIIDAIAASKVLVLIYSDNANRSQQVMREVERAVAKNVVIIPFRIENVALSKSLEYFLSAPHWLDAYPPPLDKHFGLLSRTVTAVLNETMAGEIAAPTAPAQSASPASVTPLSPTFARRTKRRAIALLSFILALMLGLAVMTLVPSLRPWRAKTTAATRADADQPAAAEVEKLGGHVEWDAAGLASRVISAHFRGMAVSNAALACLKSLSHLQELDLRGATLANLVDPVPVAAKVSGNVISLGDGIRDNALVAKGQLLMKLDPSYCQAAWAQADATLKSEQVKLEQARKQLSAMPSDVAEAEVKSTENDVAVATASLKAAQDNLDGCQITAATDGRLTGVMIQPGEVVAIGQVLFTIIPANEFEALAQLRGLAELQSLDLSQTNVSDPDLEYLKSLTQLRTLVLSKTAVTDQGAKKLQEALPQCKIVR